MPFIICSLCGDVATCNTEYLLLMVSMWTLWGWKVLHFRGVHFRGAHFRGAHFRGAHLWVSTKLSWIFQGALIVGTCLYKSTLNSTSSFQGCFNTWIGSLQKCPEYRGVHISGVLIGMLLAEVIQQAHYLPWRVRPCVRYPDEHE